MGASEWVIQAFEKKSGSEQFSHIQRIWGYGSAMEEYYPHELILGYEVWPMKGTLIGVSELSLENPINLAFWEFDHCTMGQAIKGMRQW